MKSLFSWLGFRRPASSRTPAPRPRSYRLTLEQLESRMLLSNYTASSVPDLIAEVNAANQAGGANTITLAARSNFLLTGADNATDGGTGLPVIAANDVLTIVGNGDTIARSTTSGAFRLFEVAGGASLTLKNLTLQGGLANGPSGRGAWGGAIANFGALGLNGVSVQNNVARGALGDGFTPGGDALGGGVYSNGTLTLEGNTTFKNNSAFGGTAVPPGPHAGGRPIGYRPLYESGGNGFGGGLYVAGGTANLTDVTFASNLAQGGPASVGGLDAAAGGQGLGGGMFIENGTVSLTGATFNANTAQGGQGSPSPIGPGGAGEGGGIFADGGALRIVNSTMTRNTAEGGAGGGKHASPGVGEGGGLYIAAADAAFLDAFTAAHVQDNSASTSDPDIFGTYTSI